MSDPHSKQSTWNSRFSAGGDEGRRAQRYVRKRDLPRLLPLWPAELETPTAAAHLALISKLRRALRRERQRGTSADWTYDLARHTQLLAAYRSEIADYIGCFGPITPTARALPVSSADIPQS